MPRKPRRRSKVLRPLPPLTTAEILIWADDYRARTGAWPKWNCGRIPTTATTTWLGIDAALRKGGRGMTGGSSLAQLLQAHRGVRNILNSPPLTVAQILQWADAYFAEHGRWPKENSGTIPGESGESWRGVETALRDGKRGFQGGSSLAQLFALYRARRNHLGLRPYKIAEILAWADGYYRRMGRWPKHNSGPVFEAPHENWRKIDAALRMGTRGLPGGSSLTKLLIEQRGIRSCGHRPPLTSEQILAWADAYHAEHGRWPTKNSGPVADSGGETWAAVACAFANGGRGLTGRTTLAKLLAKYGRVRRVQQSNPVLCGAT